jgi:hypothetical protein
MKKNPSSLTARAILGTLFLILGVGLVVLAININPLTLHGKTTLKSASTISPDGPTTNLSNGITFEHANLVDPFRLVGEPDIYIDHAGGVYVSGPWGTPTQTSWFWKSDDKGTNWHTIILPQKSNVQNGGGDTDITIANNNDVFGSDLQSTACLSEFRSFDAGKTFLTGEGCFPGDDRQWLGVFDPNSSATGRRVYLCANNQTVAAVVFGCYVLVSTDNGVTYQPADPVNNPSGAVDVNNGSTCIGRPAVDPNNGELFAPTGSGVFKSTDGAASWNVVGFSGAPGGVGNFSPIQMDTAGNLWQAWVGGGRTLLTYSTNRGASWHSPIQVSTGPGSPIGSNPGLRQTIFPWLSVGDPGRVVIVFYGTTDTGSVSGFPGSPNALWHAYATFSTNALAANPTFTQVQATEHVMHRGTICTGGFPGCLEANSDRSMADFFMSEKDSQGRVYIAYNENSDLSDVTQGAGQEYIGKPFVGVLRLRTGPSLFAAQGNLLPLGTVPNVNITSASASQGTVSVSGTQGLPPGNWTPDPVGDAIFPVVPTAGPNFGAMDILEASASDDGTNLTFKIKLADLSTTAIATAAPLSPAWMVTWWEGKGGIGPAGISSGPFHSHWFVQWLGQTQFVFGKVTSLDYATLGAPQPRLAEYTPSGFATGTVNGNIVTISVPLASVGGLASGDKIDHITAYALSNQGGGTPLFPVDQAKTFSYIIGTPAANQHLSDGYVEVSLDNFQTAGRATLNANNNTWTASIPGNGGTVCARQVLAKDLYTSTWDDVQAGPVSCFTIPVPVPSGVVSRMIHGSAGTFDIDMPLAGTRGIECRSGGATNDYTLVFSFPNNLTSVVGATVTNHNPTAGTGTVSSSLIGPNPNQYTVNLTNVSNVQYLTVTLNGVLDSTGATGDVTGPQVGILVGDVNASARVDAADVSSVRQQTLQTVTTSNFRNDLNASGRIDAADVSVARQQTLTSLP